jgi:hypothetical protein
VRLALADTIRLTFNWRLHDECSLKDNSEGSTITVGNVHDEMKRDFYK